MDRYAALMRNHVIQHLIASGKLLNCTKCKFPQLREMKEEHETRCNHGLRYGDSMRKTMPSSTKQPWHHLLGVKGSYVALIFSGFFAGLFALPVQVYLQARPPQKIKGRVIGAMNLVNWIAIVLAAMFFFLSDELLQWMQLPKFSIFGITGLLLIPIAVFYRSDIVSLGTEKID